RRPPRAAAGRTSGRDPPPPRIHPVAAGRRADLVPALGAVQRPDADIRRHRDRRARAPASPPRPGHRDHDPAALVHGHPRGGMNPRGGMTPGFQRVRTPWNPGSMLLAAGPWRPQDEARPTAGTGIEVSVRSTRLRSGSRAAAVRVMTTHAMM